MWNHLRGKDVTIQVLTLNSYFKLYVYKLIKLTYMIFLCVTFHFYR